MAFTRQCRRWLLNRARENSHADVGDFSSEDVAALWEAFSTHEEFVVANLGQREAREIFSFEHKRLHEASALAEFVAPLLAHQLKSLIPAGAPAPESSATPAASSAPSIPPPRPPQRQPTGAPAQPPSSPPKGIPDIADLLDGMLVQDRDAKRAAGTRR